MGVDRWLLSGGVYTVGVVARKPLLTLRLDASVRERWSAQAALRGVSLSALVRASVEAALSEPDQLGAVKPGNVGRPPRSERPQDPERQPGSESVEDRQAVVERLARTPGVTYGDLVRPARPDPRR